jgi:hypothetical protein
MMMIADSRVRAERLSNSTVITIRRKKSKKKRKTTCPLSVSPRQISLSLQRLQADNKQLSSRRASQLVDPLLGRPT